MLAGMDRTDHRPLFARRTLLRASLAGALLVPAVAVQACGTSTTGGPRMSTGLITNRPRLTHGVASGDPRADGALV